MKQQNEDIALKIGSVVINPSNFVRDLGVLLDNELAMRSHINKISSAFFMIYGACGNYVVTLIGL